MLEAQAGLLGVWISIVWSDTEEHGQRRARTVVRKTDPKLREISRCNQSNSIGHANHALFPQRLIDIDWTTYRQRVCRVQRSQNLSNLTVSVDLIQRACNELN